jgi:hypothetical protein
MTVESSTEHGTTLRAVLFESDAAAVASIAEAVRAGADLSRLKALSGALSVPAVADIGREAGAFLQDDLAGILCTGWGRYGKLRDAARESLTEPGVKRLADVGAHTITWEHDPYVDVLQDGELLLRIKLAIALAIDVAYLAAEIQDGCLVAVRGGAGRGELSLAVGAAPPFRRPVNLDLSRAVRLRRPLRLAWADPPETGASTSYGSTSYGSPSNAP